MEKMSAAFIKAAKTVGSKRLQDADVDVGIVMVHESIAVQRDEASERVEITIEQLLAEVGGQVGLGVV